MVKIEIVQQDVIQVEADLLLLKHAQGFHGADETVSLRLHQSGACDLETFQLEDGQDLLLKSHSGIAAPEVLFLGTPSLREFRYREIRLFSQRAIESIAKRLPAIECLATTIHGAGYGLDIAESFRSMLFGFQQGLTSHPLRNLKRILFVEKNKRRFEMLEAAVADIKLVLPDFGESSNAAAKPSSVPSPATTRKIVFVAMPFSDSFEDVYQFGIYQTVRRCGYVCEKVDESAYAGSIVDRIINGIESAEFVIADLSEERPNVYLEVGFAWGLRKPVILVAREGQRLHFDLSHHKCLFYKNISKLAEQLERTIHNLFLDARP